MRSSFRSVLSAAAIAASVFIAQASDASAAIFYNWQGACSSGCIGTATGVLELDDSYAPGARLNLSHFRSFTYFANTASGPVGYSVPTDGTVTSIRGSLPAPGGSGAASVALRVGNFFKFNYFGSVGSGFFSGAWSTRLSSSGVGFQKGNGSTWSGGSGPVALPAPGSLLAMLGALLAGAAIYGYGAYRRREDEGSLVPA